jgi:hypothetical protein
MQRQRALKLIHESLELAKTASPEQRVRLLRMVKECYARIRSEQTIQESTDVSKTVNPDYIDEK